TANAVASFAFNNGDAVVDTNVKRVLYRAFDVSDDDDAFERVAFSMGREGQLLPSFGQIHHRYGTPFVAILASAVVMLGSVA
ncbi:hypothetical protein PM032_18460, partial [Halorubrum ezzemoulense]|nr:hypothetical protein [Halorubrum ezzemoulense]